MTFWVSTCSHPDSRDCPSLALVGPLQHGMVVSQAMLGPLVRRTAINASRAITNKWRAMGLFRYKIDSPSPCALSKSDIREPTCPYDARCEIVNSLRQHAHSDLNGSFGAFLRASLAPMPDGPLTKSGPLPTVSLKPPPPPTRSVTDESKKTP